MYFEAGEKYEILDKLSSQESKADLWILSRLSATIETVDKAFKNYEFSIATQSCYSFWLYDLCDVYLECLKPVFFSDDEQKKSTARRILYTCLDFGLRMLAPFMPFITEELFQRLPRNNLEIPSICVAPFPEISKYDFKNENIEKDFEFAQKIIKAIRSARADYNILMKTKTEAYVKCTDEEMSRIMREFRNEIETLCYCSKVEIVTEVPQGCAILSINAQCEVHLMLKGIIEADKEVAKLEKKSDQLQQLINNLKKKMSIEDYANKVPAKVQAENSETLKESEIEIERIKTAIEALKLL